MCSRRKPVAAVVERKNVNFGVGGGEDGTRYLSSCMVMLCSHLICVWQLLPASDQGPPLQQLH